MAKQPTNDKVMSDLQRLLAAQKFKSQEEVEAFLNDLMGKEIPSMPTGQLSAAEQARDLVYEASELPKAKAKTKVEQALQLDPDCIAAYEFLGIAEHRPEVAILFFEKGVEIGRRIFGGAYLKANKGRFWGIHETRHFMSCLLQYAFCLYATGKKKECVAILEEMIELNPNDNQGARDQLMLYLVELDEEKKFLEYSEKYQEDEMAAFLLFTHALFAFKTEGASENAKSLLKKAVAQNKYVVPKLISNLRVHDLPGHYSFGDNNEAKYYAFFAWQIWRETPGAKAWLKNTLRL